MHTEQFFARTHLLLQLPLILSAHGPRAVAQLLHRRWNMMMIHPLHPTNLLQPMEDATVKKHGWSIFTEATMNGSKAHELKNGILENHPNTVPESTPRGYFVPSPFQTYHP